MASTYGKPLRVQLHLVNRALQDGREPIQLLDKLINELVHTGGLALDRVDLLIIPSTDDRLRPSQPGSIVKSAVSKGLAEGPRIELRA
jgi:hypothetical protein